jgi:hypothetical protein
MATSQYDRAIIKVLQEGYHIDVATTDIKKTGSHRGLEFTYNGRKVALTLHDSKQRQSTGNLIAMKIQDIERALGPPPLVPPPRPRRTIDQLSVSAKTLDPYPEKTIEAKLANRVGPGGEPLPRTLSPLDQLAHKTIAEWQQLAGQMQPKNITEEYLKSLLDAVNYVIENSKWRMVLDRKTGRYSFFRIRHVE